MKFIPVYIVLVLSFVISSCSRDKVIPLTELDTSLRNLVSSTAKSGRLDYFILPEADDFENIPQDPKNPLTTEKVELGKMLFFETAFANKAAQLEGIGTYSCSTCHIPSAGFRSGSPQGIADGGIGFGINGKSREKNIKYKESEMDVQGARPFSMIGVAFVENTMWNGSFGSTNVNIGTEDKWVGDHATNNLGLLGIEAQNIEGMEVHKFEYSKEEVEHNGYKELFDLVFPEIPEEERYTNKTASFALSAYIRTIFPNEAPFQKWLKGDITALSNEEREGAMLFFGKAACTNCHSGPALSSVEFQAIGVNDMYQRPSFKTNENDLRNFGRGGFTGNPEDFYKFKVPQLYNMKDTEFYFHGSSKTSLRSVVEYFNDAIPENKNVPIEQISSKFKPLNLSPEEVDNLTLFLEISLRDPDLERYQPVQLRSGNCFPNADFQSMMDLGCN